MVCFEIWQDGIMVASAESPKTHVALREIAGYAAQYERDGPIKIRQKRERKRPAAAPSVSEA